MMVEHLYTFIYISYNFNTINNQDEADTWLFVRLIFQLFVKIVDVNITRMISAIVDMMQWWTI